MNDTPQPVAPPPPQADNPTETAAHGIEDVPQANRITEVGTGVPLGLAPGIPHSIGDFTVLQKLGEGGMGAVYLAEDAKLQRKAAIKTMKPELAVNQTDRDRFLREARAAAAVEHDNIVPIWGVGEVSDGTPFIVMPFLKGESLDARLKREPVSPLALILKVARDVTEGLAAAHAHGLIHRDIKPANIWLEGEVTSSDPEQQVRRCKILDFGLARSVDKGGVQLTTSGAILGTPEFMAPEQARGKKLDSRTDLWSLGVTLYRMTTGAPPFTGDTPMEVLCSVLADAPLPVHERAAHLPTELLDLINRLMSKEPDARPQLVEVATTIRQLLNNPAGTQQASITHTIRKKLSGRSTRPTPLTSTKKNLGSEGVASTPAVPRKTQGGKTKLRRRVNLLARVVVVAVVVTAIAVGWSRLTPGGNNSAEKQAEEAKAEADRKAAEERVANKPTVLTGDKSGEIPAVQKESGKTLNIFIANGYMGEPPALFLVLHNDTEDLPIVDVKVTALVFIGPDNLMLPQFMFSKKIDALKKNDGVEIRASELVNDLGERLSDSKVKVTHVWVLGKVGGVPKGTVRKLGDPRKKP